MSRDGYAVIDVDAHFTLEKVKDLIEYLDEPWRTRVAAEPGLIMPASLGDRMVGGRIRRDDIPYPRQNEAVLARTGPMTPAKIPDVMERLGIDASIQIVNALLLMGHLSVRDLAAALCHAYADYMLDRVVDPAKGIYMCVVVPWQDPEEGAALIRRVGHHPAVVGVCFMTAGANPPLGDIRYNAVYAAAQDYRLPIVYHSAPGLTLTEGGSGYVDGFQRLIEAHSLGFLLSNQIQLTSIILQGLPERYPSLKFVFQESGVFGLRPWHIAWTGITSSADRRRPAAEGTAQRVSARSVLLRDAADRGAQRSAAFGSHLPDDERLRAFHVRKRLSAL